MALQIVESAPKIEDFTLLSQYHEQTPESFDGSTVLHQLAQTAKVKVAKEDFGRQAELRRLAGTESPTSTEEGEEEEDVILADIEVWVTDKYMVLYASKQNAGVRILYPSITITAQDGSEVLLELNLSPPDTADEDLEVVQLRVVPDTVKFADEGEKETGANGSSASEANGGHRDGASAALFKAISDCQELNPDPRLPGDEDEEMDEGGEGWFDETAPGATGWITSENMADFMDEDGNFRMPPAVEVIGNAEDATNGVHDEAAPATGSVRTRTAAELDGENGEDDESKWQRTG